MSKFSLKQVHLHPDLTLLEVENPLARARISLFGGQVLQYCPAHDGRERLFLSETARLDGSKSIRGGIPICWPWFGAHPSDPAQPAHGFARTLQWMLIALENTPTATRLLLRPIQLPALPGGSQVVLELEIHIGAELTVALHTRNTGSKPMPLAAALHSYFAVQDIEQVTLTGLTGLYSDKTRNWQVLPSPTPYQISAETDRIHLEAAAQVNINEPDITTSVASKGHDSIVVWNPWTACAEQFVDLTAESYRHLLCVETALTQGYLLAPGASHTLQQIIT